MTLASFHIVGDAFVDIFCFMGSRDDNTFVIPEPGGDAELSEPVQTMAGGSGVNTATHLQSLLLQQEHLAETASNNDDDYSQVCLYTALNPSDEYGKLLLSHAEQHGFRLCVAHGNSSSSSSSLATGHCLVLVANQERSFLTHRGCIGAFAPNHVTVERIISNDDGPVHLHIAGYYNVPHFWNGHLADWLTRIRQERRRRTTAKTVISLVPQHDATGQWDGGIDQLMMSSLDFLILNELEATRIMQSGVKRRASQSGAGSSYVAMDEHHDGGISMSDLIHYYGHHCSQTTIVVMTRGANGALAFQNCQVLAELAQSVAVSVVDPTGAGDAFAAGFLQGLWAWGKMDNHHHLELENDGPWLMAAIEHGLLYGCAAGTASVQIKGASIPAEYSTISAILEEQKGSVE